MGILEELSKPNFKVTKTDKSLIKYIEENSDDVIYKSISEIARESKIGEATITRFTKKAGFKGFQDFKITLAKDLSIRKKTSVISSHVHKNEGVMETSSKLLRTTISVLEETVGKTDKNIINQCRKLILTAKKVYFIGIGYSGVVATDSNYKFMRVGLNTASITDSHTMVIMSSIMNRGDVIVAISHSGITKEILRTVEIAKENDIKIISLTEDTNNPLRNLADAQLTYVSSETILETGSVSSKIQQIFLMDLVYTEVIKDIFSEAVDRKLRTTNAIEYYNVTK